MRDRNRTVTVEAEPYPFAFVPAQCALLIIDMQRDFLEPGGFGEMLGMMFHNYAEPSSRTASCWPRGAPPGCRSCTPAKAIALT